MKVFVRCSVAVNTVVALAIATPGLFMSAAAAPDPQATFEVAQDPAAQATIVGRCRAAKHSTPIFAERAAVSPVTRLLATNDQVTLSENGATEGLIGVSAPRSGYVFAVNLKSCNGNNPTPVGQCRRVIQSQGLIVRTQPNPNSPLANPSQVGYQTTVTLSTNPATSQKGPDGRTWVQISQPVNGWVSNGFPGGVGNLAYCQ